jgi:DNA modification methylase
VPPFSVLDARQWYWQDRKRQWIALGIHSEVGRGEAPGAGAPRPNGTHGTNEPFGAPYAGGDAWRGRKDAAASFKSQARLAALQTTGSSQPSGDQPQATGTSIFDPTLTELLVRWFSAEGGEVLDPFAGGSVRGIVASKLGRHYTGIELRPEQVAANEQQRAAICGPDGGPRWICGDSLAEIPKLPAEYAADMILSCPPYFDLEVYSQEAADISAMDYPGFLQAYRAIIAAAVARLRDDRFACWVVGEVRDARGIYRNFVGDTVAAFEAAGCRYYNEAILVTAVGSLPVRAGRIFETARKLGKSHQNVLVFCKGVPKRAAAACGSAEIVVGEGLFGDGTVLSDEPDGGEEPDAMPQKELAPA